MVLTPAASPDQMDDYTPKAPPTGVVLAPVLQSGTSLLMALPPVPISYNVENRIWELLEDYQYNHDGTTLIVRAGYRFDLSSIPRRFGG